MDFKDKEYRKECKSYFNKKWRRNFRNKKIIKDSEKLVYIKKLLSDDNMIKRIAEYNGKDINIYIDNIYVFTHQLGKYPTFKLYRIDLTSPSENYSFAGQHNYSKQQIKLNRNYLTTKKSIKITLGHEMIHNYDHLSFHKRDIGPKNMNSSKDFSAFTEIRAGKYDCQSTLDNEDEIRKCTMYNAFASVKDHCKDDQEAAEHVAKHFDETYPMDIFHEKEEDFCYTDFDRFVCEQIDGYVV